MPLDLAGRIRDLLKDKPWYSLPRLLAVPKLVEIRNELREKNLHDTEEPAFTRAEIPANLDPALREGRTADGSHNDLHFPQMGCAGRRFGRNFPVPTRNSIGGSNRASEGRHLWREDDSKSPDRGVFFHPERDSRRV